MRRFFRLLKSFQELYALKLLLSGRGKVKEIESKDDLSRDEFSRLMTILIRGCYAGYYFFDNIHILEKCRFLRAENPSEKSSIRKAMDFWFIGLVLRCLLLLRDILRVHHQEIKQR